MLSSEDDVNKTPPKKKKKIIKRLQKFKDEWINRYNWLCKDNNDEYNAKCKICSICFSIKNSGIGQIKQHNETKQHQSQLNITKQNGIMEKFVRPSVSSLSIDNNIMAGELAFTYHTVKHNLSYNSMDCTMKLNKIIYTDSKNANNISLGRTKMSALVNNVLGPHALQQVLRDLLRPDTYFSIQSDASNRKNIKLFPLVVQYFDANNGLQHKLIDFYENPDESATGMYEAIKQSLSMKSLNFERVTALSADNTNANFGIHNSLFKNIEKEVPHIIKGNCHAHIIHNTVKHSMISLNYDVENVILKIYSHFSMSACRREELKKFVSAVDGEWQELKRHVGTRWLSLLPAVDTIIKNWTPLINYFLSLKDKCPIVVKNILMLNENDGCLLVLIYLNFSSHFLSIFNKTIKKIEGSDVTILDLFEIMKALKLELESRKKDKFFGYETNLNLKVLKTNNPSNYESVVINLLSFIDTSLTYLNQWFNFEEDSFLNIIQNMNLKKEMCFEQIEQIIQKNDFKNKLNIEMDELYNEILTFNEVYKKINCELFPKKSTCDKWYYILKTAESPQTFPNILKIISYFLSVPATSAFAERIFSVMNIKWREERNRANIDTIKNELLIYVNLNIECKDSLNYFKNQPALLNDAQKENKYSFKK